MSVLPALRASATSEVTQLGVQTHPNCGVISKVRKSAADLASQSAAEVKHIAEREYRVTGAAVAVGGGIFGDGAQAVFATQVKE